MSRKSKKKSFLKMVKHHGSEALKSFYNLKGLPKPTSKDCAKMKGTLDEAERILREKDYKVKFFKDPYQYIKECGKRDMDSIITITFGCVVVPQD